ncbi:MAG TPA: hypothetical protein VLB44_19095 [Kofleriaceae bacterium]|nr:hypothetical protein [Kofleriaceae bacterium]
MKQPVDDAALTPIQGKRLLLVLDNPTGGLAAAAVLVVDGLHGHISLFAVDERLAGHGLEDRMLAVIEAMSEAFGLRTVDVPARRAA